MRAWFVGTFGAVGLLCLACGNDAGSGTGGDGGQPAASTGGSNGAGGSGGAGGEGGAADTRGGEQASDAESCLEDVVAPSFGFVEVQRFTASEPELELWRARRVIDAPTVGETRAYALERVWIATEDGGLCLGAEASMSYEWAHHNWAERWEARFEAMTYAGFEEFQQGGVWHDTLTALDPDGRLQFGPVELEDGGCYTLPYDLNACVLRDRIDEPPPGWGD